MTSRVLPFEEWDRLPEHLAPLIAALRPSDCRVLVVEDNGEIVGRWILFPMLHAEAIEIAPSHRKKGSVARRLLQLMYRSAKELGFDRVWTASDDAEVTKVLAHPMLNAVPIPALPFVLPVKGVN